MTQKAFRKQFQSVPLISSAKRMCMNHQKSPKIPSNPSSSMLSTNKMCPNLAPKANPLEFRNITSEIRRWYFKTFPTKLCTLEKREKRHHQYEIETREKERKSTKAYQNPKFDCHSCNPEFVSKHQKYQNSPMPNPAFSNFQIVIRQQSSFQTPLIINLDTKFESRHRYLYLFLAKHLYFRSIAKIIYQRSNIIKLLIARFQTVFIY